MSGALDAVVCCMKKNKPYFSFAKQGSTLVGLLAAALVPVAAAPVQVAGTRAGHRCGYC